ncbi:MAG: hypothetical protein IMZ62_08035 [Chloroflexi bacterium]|nr:hypothetical protein [Chloroflexota bacterium]MBE3118787.1 hypothetical protein [Candidatus Atribacteria bacterium]
MNDFPRLLRAPTIEQVVAEHGEPPVSITYAPKPEQEIIALGGAVFQAIAPRVYDSHRLLSAHLAHHYGQNLWIIPSQERMPFPDAPLFALAAMFRMEKLANRPADWFLWIEDDVSVPQDLFEILRASADPEKRPFVCAPGFIRNPPFQPAIWETKNGAYTRWKDVPDSGVFEVTASGLVAAIFHRSLFNRLPQPWFAVTSNKMIVNADGKAEVDRGMRPDSWWADLLQKHGIPTYVNCDAHVTHFGMPLPVNRYTAPLLRALPFFQNAQEYERTFRGLPSRNSGDLSAGVRPGIPEGVVCSGETGCGTGPIAAGGEPALLQGPGPASTARPELPVQLSAVDDPALWRGSGNRPWWEEA